MRRSFVVLGLSVLVCAATVSYADLSLDAQRTEKEMQEQKVAPAQARIKAAAGTNIPIHVDWNSFVDSSHMQYIGAATGQTATAIESICKDAMGKKAVASKVKSIDIRRSAPHEADKADFKDGMVKINESFEGTWIGASGIQSVIEKGL